MRLMLGTQGFILDASTGVPLLHYALEKMKIHEAELRSYQLPTCSQLAEIRRLTLIHNVLREALRYRRNSRHNQSEAEIVKTLSPLFDALDIINNQ